MNAVSLKERLDAVWNKNEIACPNNLVRWSEKNTGYTRFAEFELYYTKGTRHAQKKIAKRRKIRLA